jgi:hypothetical protein
VIVKENSLIPITLIKYLIGRKPEFTKLIYATVVIVSSFR